MQKSFSTEIRWFQKGALEKAIITTLADSVSEEAISEEKRIDYYLVTSGLEHVGIKMREGRCEFKHHLKVWPPFNEIQKGDLQATSWLKLSFTTQTPQKDLAHLLPSHGYWLSVTKRRWLYDTESGSTPAKACQVELSEIIVNKQKYHSICFEQEGVDDSSHEALAVALNDRSDLLHYAHDNGMKQQDYPAFLISCL